MEKRILDKKSILKNSLIMIYKSSIYLLLFELIYKGIITILIKPILNSIVSLFIRAGGYDILVNGEISQFLLSFTGLVMIVIVMMISIVIVYYEFTVILFILDMSRKKDEIKLLQITENALLKLKNVVKYDHIGISLYILVLIPFLNIGIQSSLVPTLSIPEFITGELSKYPGSGVLFVLLGFVLVFIFAKLFIALPVMIFSDKNFNESARISFKTITDEGFQIALLIISGMLIWLAVTYLPFMIFENTEFILLRMMRFISNISMTIFTLLISPFILSISLETYNAYVEFGDIEREEICEQIELGYFGKKFWNLLSIILGTVQKLIRKIKDNIKVFIVPIIVLIVGINIYSEESVSPIYDKQLLIGHRGGEYGIENTIDTILYAGTHGADYVEMDVLLTKDNVPVVIHDNNLKRLAKQSKKISDLTVQEVKQITIKSGKKTDTIPTLEELAKAVKGKTKLLLEFKTHGKESESIIDNTIRVLEQEGILEETIFHTAEDPLIKEFNEKYKDLYLGYVFIGKLGTFSAQKMANMPVDFVSAEESLINKIMIREIHKSGKAVFAWTINDDYKVERLLELGVDGIITDYPVEMVDLRDQYKDYHKDY